MMGRALHEVVQARQAGRKLHHTEWIKLNLAALREAGIPFGGHGLQTTVDARVEFWPSTGRWWVPKSGHRGFGVSKLISYVHGTRRFASAFDAGYDNGDRGNDGQNEQWVAWVYDERSRAEWTQGQETARRELFCGCTLGRKLPNEKACRHCIPD